MSETPAPYTTGTQDSGDEQPARPVTERTAPGYRQTAYSNGGTHTQAGYVSYVAHTRTATAIRTAPILSAAECQAVAHTLARLTPWPWAWAGAEGYVVERENAPLYAGLDSAETWVASAGIRQTGKLAEGCIAIRPADAAFLATAPATIAALLRTVAHLREAAETAIRAMEAAAAERDGARAELAARAE